MINKGDPDDPCPWLGKVVVVRYQKIEDFSNRHPELKERYDDGGLDARAVKKAFQIPDDEIFWYKEGPIFRPGFRRKQRKTIAAVYSITAAMRRSNIDYAEKPWTVRFMETT